MFEVLKWLFNALDEAVEISSISNLVNSLKKYHLLN